MHPSLSSARRVCAGFCGGMVLLAVVLASMPAAIVATPGKAYAVACICIGLATVLGLLAWLAPARTAAVRLPRRIFASAAGIAAYLVLTWACWALGVPLELGVVRRGQIAGQYWVGPAAIVYAVVCWLAYRRALAADGGGR